MDAVERHAFDRVLRLGQLAIYLFLSLQGHGDLGPSVVTADGETLGRSHEPVRCEVRTVFGQHEYHEFVYSPGPHLKIALRPLAARMSLPAGISSYLFEEFSQFFCVEQAFGLSRLALQTTLRQDVCVDQLQDINRRLGTQAAEYLEELPVPAASDEGELLVLTLDGQVSLREISEVCLPDDVHAVDILDIIHVAGYVQRAAKVFYSQEQQREAFSRAVLGKLLVKDRMERTGMRWRLSSAAAMPNVRAVFQSSHWETFHQTRIAKEQSQLHPHRILINNYHPLTT